MKKLYFKRPLCATLAALSLVTCVPSASAASLSGSLTASLTTTSSSLVSSNTDSTRKQVSTLALSNGYYVFAAHENKDRVANVTFASVQEDRATLGISVWDAESNEIFYIERVGEGNYVTIAPAYCKSLVLNALLGANCAVGQSVTLHRKTAGDTASWWLPVLNSDGSYTFVNKASGLVMDLANGDSDTIGNGLLCYTKNGWLPAQGWYVFSVGDPHAEQKTPDYLGTTDASSSTGTTMYVNTSSAQLRVRRSPSTSASVVTKLSRGTQVTAYEPSGSWTRIKTGSVEGWVATQYLSPTNPVTTMTSPVPSGCKFSKKTKDSGWYGYHDINRNVSTSTPVYAVSSGTAYYYQYNTNGKLRSYGYCVKLITDNGYEIRYCHLSRFVGMTPTITSDTASPCSGAKSNGYLGSRRVSAGETLAYIGQTGNASGVHLHIEVYKINANNTRTRVDPTSLFSGLV